MPMGPGDEGTPPPALLWHNRERARLSGTTAAVGGKKGWDAMDNEGNWDRQLAALVLLSASRAAVEYITNPGSRTDAQKQLRDQFANIDYDAVARALTRALDDVATTSKGRLSDTIDVLHDRSVDAVEGAKSRAEKQLGQKKSGGKLRWLFLLAFGAAAAYFIMDEQRRDDLLDRLTGA